MKISSAIKSNYLLYTIVFLILSMFFLFTSFFFKIYNDIIIINNILTKQQNTMNSPELSSIINTLIDKNLSNLNFIQSKYIFLALLLILTSALLGLYIYNFNYLFYKKLKYMNQKLNDLNKGNNTIPDKSAVIHTDELTEITNNFTYFEAKLHNLIQNIKTGAFSIQQSVEILNTYNDNLVKKSETQHIKVELINENLSQVKKIMNLNNDNTFKLNKLSKNTKKITEIISLEAKHLSEAINVIFSSSEKIEEISTSIEELSFQTTILSLNSAVESTRIQAGSKSFNVISNEIHKLSTMGKNAAKEIKSLSNENKIKIDESKFYLNNTVKLIETIVTKINEISMLLDDITQGSQVEAEEILNIVSSLYEIEISSQQTSSIAKDTLTLSENLNNEAINFLDIISSFDKSINNINLEIINDNSIDIILSEEEKDRILATLDIKKNRNQIR